MADRRTTVVVASLAVVLIPIIKQRFGIELHEYETEALIGLAAPIWHGIAAAAVWLWSQIEPRLPPPRSRPMSPALPA